VITVLLFTVVATWNNYFLPLIMLSQAEVVSPHGRPQPVECPVEHLGGQAIYNLVITGSLLAVIRSSCVPVHAALLAVRSGRGKRQGVIYRSRATRPQPDATPLHSLIHSDTSRGKAHP